LAGHLAVPASPRLPRIRRFWGSRPSRQRIPGRSTPLRHGYASCGR